MKAPTEKTPFEFNWISKYREVYFGIATLLIIYHHLTIQCNNSVLGYLYMFTRVIGALGVDAFLILSGMGLYISYSRDTDVKSFYKKRLLRIIPTYILVAVPWYIYKTIVLNESIGYFFQSILQIRFWTEGNGGEWYIVFILIMYILFPFMYRVLFNNKNSINLVGLTGIIVSWILLVSVVYSVFPTIYHNTDWIYPRVPAFVTGMIVGKLVKEKKTMTLKPALYVSLIACISSLLFEAIMCLKGSEYGYGFFARLVYLPLSLSLMFLYSIIKERLFRKQFQSEKSIIWIGRHSLESYLLNQKLIEVSTTLIGGGKDYSLQPYRCGSSVFVNRPSAKN